MDFFPGPPDPPNEDEVQEQPQPVWMNPPEDVLPGVVPVELVLGRSASTVVALTGMRAFPTGLQMNLAVRVRGRVSRRDLNSEVFDGPYGHDMDPQWQAGRLKWGFELADGRRVTNVDPWPEQPNQDHSRPHRPDDWLWEPDHPVLQGGGGGGGQRSVDRDYWLATSARGPVSCGVPVAGPGHRPQRSGPGRRAVPRGRRARSPRMAVGLTTAGSRADRLPGLLGVHPQRRVGASRAVVHRRESQDGCSRSVRQDGGGASWRIVGGQDRWPWSAGSARLSGNRRRWGRGTADHVR